MKLLDIDLKGLPAVHSVRVYALDMPTVDVMLAVADRRGVERWARRLGVQVDETPVSGTSGAIRHIAAIREQRGIRFQVWIRVFADPDGGGACAP